MDVLFDVQLDFPYPGKGLNSVLPCRRTELPRRRQPLELDQLITRSAKEGSLSVMLCPDLRGLETGLESKGVSKLLSSDSDLNSAWLDTA